MVARVVERSPGTSPGAVAAGLPGPSSSQRSRRVATDRFRFDRPCVDVSRSVIRDGWCQGVAGSAPAHHEGIRAFARRTSPTTSWRPVRQLRPVSAHVGRAGGRGGLPGPVARCVYRQCRHRQRRPPRLHQELTRCHVVEGGPGGFVICERGETCACLAACLAVSRLRELVPRMLELVGGSVGYGICLLCPLCRARWSSTPVDVGVGVGVDGRHCRSCVHGDAAGASEYGSHATASSAANGWTAAAGSSGLARCCGCPGLPVLVSLSRTRCPYLPGLSRPGGRSVLLPAALPPHHAGHGPAPPPPHPASRMCCVVTAGRYQITGRMGITAGDAGALWFSPP